MDAALFMVETLATLIYQDTNQLGVLNSKAYVFGPIFVISIHRKPICCFHDRPRAGMEKLISQFFLDRTQRDGITLASVSANLG